jgi:O-antigen/teichoic acid export membrane protein
MKEDPIMGTSKGSHRWRLPQVLRSHLAERQHRTAYFLTLSNLLGAATGVLFWLLLVRVAGLDPTLIGIGYSVVALGTLVGLLAKGGLDTAILLKVPASASADGRRLLTIGFGVATCVAILMTTVLAASALGFGFFPDLDGLAWVLVGVIAVLLVLTWLQDAYFVALGQAGRSLERNFVLSVGRLMLPLPVVLLAFAQPVPLTWALALGASAAVGLVRIRTMPQRTGRTVPGSEFFRTAARNVSGGAAEFLPGLLLVPLVLLLEGPEAAAYFGIAWTAAALLFQISGAIGRGALAQMVQAGPAGTRSAVRKGAMQHLWLVAPLTIAVGLLAAPLLSIFGAAYASNGAGVLAILCASILVVAPAWLYLAVLRSQDRTWPLVALPVALLLALVVLAPLLGARYGLVGIAFAWFLANTPFGLYGAVQLSRQPREVISLAQPGTVRGRLDLE